MEKNDLKIYEYTTFNTDGFVYQYNEINLFSLYDELIENVFTTFWSDIIYFVQKINSTLSFEKHKLYSLSVFILLVIWFYYG